MTSSPVWLPSWLDRMPHPIIAAYPMAQFLELRAGPSVLVVSPETGGSITRYGSDHDGGTIEWLRPALPDAADVGSAGDTSCFPMVPFSNRIREARFHFRGRLIQLPQNFSPEPHAIHGHGWREAWKVIDGGEHSATIEYRHAAAAWPWAYRARQAFALTPDRLTVRMSVTNESPDPMPVGFGLHPYFVRTPAVRVRAAVQSMWSADANAIPSRLVLPPESLLLDGEGLSPDATPLDNNFIGFGGQAIIAWPEWKARLWMTADTVFSCLVVYTPAGRDFFCAEPATNCIDAFNLADVGRTDTGMLVVPPAETLSGVVTLTPETLVGP